MRVSVASGLALALVIAFAGVNTAATAQQRTVALTFDDLPSADSADASAVHHETEALLRALAKHQALATGFVIGRSAESLPAGGVDTLRLWVAAGHDLGNHTYSHTSVNKLSVEQFAEEVTRAEPTFVPLLPRDRRGALFLRFPFNHTGDTSEKRAAVDRVLTERHYEVAVCTMENADYMFAAGYTKALNKGDVDMAARIKREYVAYTAAMVDYFIGLHRQLFGRETSHVMLLHVNRLNADVLNQVLEVFEERHFRFVPLREAQADDAYRTPVTWVTQAGPMWAYRWARSLGIRVNGQLEPVPAPWVQEYAR